MNWAISEPGGFQTRDVHHMRIEGGRAHIQIRQKYNRSTRQKQSKNNRELFRTIDLRA